MDLSPNGHKRYLPPADYSETLTKAFPIQKESLKTLAIIFSDVFYGNHPVSNETYTKYNKAFSDVVKKVLS